MRRYYFFHNDKNSFILVPAIQFTDIYYIYININIIVLIIIYNVLG